MCKILQSTEVKRSRNFGAKEKTWRQMPLFAAFRSWATRHLLFGVGFQLSAGKSEWLLFRKTSQFTSAFVPMND